MRWATQIGEDGQRPQTTAIDNNPEGVGETRKRKRKELEVSSDGRDATRWRHGLRCLRQGDYVGALAEWAKCTRPGIQSAMAEAYLRQAMGTRDHAQARAILQKAAQLVPDDPRPIYHLTLRALRLGQAIEGLALSRQAVRLDPHSERYRRTEALAGAMAGEPPSDWRGALVAGVGAGRWPEVGPDAPGWLVSLLRAMEAATRTEWETVRIAVEEALTDASIPERAHATLLYYRALAQVAQGGAETLVVTGPFQARTARLSRVVAAHRLADTLRQKDPQAAEEVVRTGALPELRDPALVQIGALYVKMGQIGPGIRTLLSAGADTMAHPVAYLLEEVGSAQCIEIWERVLRQARAGTLRTQGVDSQGAVCALLRHLRDLWKDEGEEKALVYAEELVTAWPDPSVDDLMQLFRLWDAVHRDLDDRAIGLLETVLRAQPDHLEAKARLDGLWRRLGYWEKAIDSSEQRWRVDPNDPELRMAAVEDRGRMLLLALLRNDLEWADRVVGQLRERAGTEEYDPFRVVAILGAAALERIRNRARGKLPIGKWDAAFRDAPGVVVPTVAFVLRGFLSLMNKSWKSGYRLFMRVDYSHDWHNVQWGGDGSHAFYLRWMAFSSCWSRQLRTRAPLVECSEGCYVTWRLLQRAYDTGSGTALPLPECVKGCPNVEKCYRLHQRMLRQDESDAHPAVQREVQQCLANIERIRA